MSAEIKAVISKWIDQKMTTASSPQEGTTISERDTYE